MRNALIGAALLLAAAPGAALAFDGSVAFGLTFDNQGMRPFADMEGTRAERGSGASDGGWIPGPSRSNTSAPTGGGGGLAGSNPGRSSAPGRGAGHGYGSLKLR